MQIFPIIKKKTNLGDDTFIFFPWDICCVPFLSLYENEVKVKIWTRNLPYTVNGESAIGYSENWHGLGRTDFTIFPLATLSQGIQ